MPQSCLTCSHASGSGLANFPEQSDYSIFPSTGRAQEGKAVFRMEAYRFFAETEAGGEAGGGAGEIYTTSPGRA